MTTVRHRLSGAVQGATLDQPQLARLHLLALAVSLVFTLISLTLASVSVRACFPSFVYSP